MELLRDKIKRDTYMVSKLCNMIARGDLRDNHPQQRKSGQWSKETRDNFIVTVIKNEDFDPIKICEQLTDKGIVLWLIDGLQRSTTIENYNARELLAEINNQANYALVIGNIILSRSSIRMVAPANEVVLNSIN